MTAGMIRLMNQSVMVVAKMANGLSVNPPRKSAATLPRNPKSINAIFIGLMVCIKKIAATIIIALANGILMPKNVNNKTNCMQ